MSLRLSIVTPSYNQGIFIETTIKSVIEQGYDNFEYFVIDGGSNDDSVSIIRQYEDRITKWVSEPDSGQSHAINKGFGMCTGDVLAWINSDDEYLPGSISTAMKYLERHPEVDMVYGDQEDIDKGGRTFRMLRSSEFSLLGLLSRGMTIPQPASFFRKRVIDNIGGLDEELQWVMDYEFFLRMAFGGFTIKHLPQTLCRFRYHDESKTVSGKLETDNHAEHMIMIQQKFLEKYNTKSTIPLTFRLLEMIGLLHRTGRRVRNVDKYFTYRDYYMARIGSMLRGSNMHKY